MSGGSVSGDPAGGVATRVRVVLPGHLRNLAGVPGEVEVALEGPATIERILNALEAEHPVLRGTIRDHGGGPRRAMMRFFACGEDLSHDDPDEPLPDAVSSGREPLLVVGAIAGG